MAYNYNWRNHSFGILLSQKLQLRFEFLKSGVKRVDFSLKFSNIVGYPLWF